MTFYRLRKQVRVWHHESQLVDSRWGSVHARKTQNTNFRAVLLVQIAHINNKRRRRLNAPLRPNQQIKLQKISAQRTIISISNLKEEDSSGEAHLERGRKFLMFHSSMQTGTPRWLHVHILCTVSSKIENVSYAGLIFGLIWAINLESLKCPFKLLKK